jgi:hypothetical protein
MGGAEMKNWRLAALALQIIMMAGCNTQARIAATRSTEIALGNARNVARVDCSRPAECERLWHRTELYLAQRSAAPIRHADDTSIETAVPHTFGTIYVWATRTIDAGGVSTIRIIGMCRGMYRADGSPGWLYQTCAEQIRAVETDFRSFIGAAS